MRIQLRNFVFGYRRDKLLSCPIHVCFWPISPQEIGVQASRVPLAAKLQGLHSLRMSVRKYARRYWFGFRILPGSLNNFMSADLLFISLDIMFYVRTYCMSNPRKR